MNSGKPVSSRQKPCWPRFQLSVRPMNPHDQVPDESTEPAHVGSRDSDGEETVGLKPQFHNNVLCPLTKNGRVLLRDQLGNVRDETSPAHLSLQNPRSEMDVLTCPQLWRNKARTQSLSFSEASNRIGNDRRLRCLAGEVKPKEVHRLLLLETSEVR